ncbi:HipA domain-containing protein [Bradyrhizobium jicamae]|nr:HipA domain-containing protein [Bradyrhizobium jicamae]
MWIVKLPSERYAAVPENELSMMTLAARLGMDVPEVQLVD